MFQPANRWERRAFEKAENPWHLVYPHPYDILFSKLRRAEIKDIDREIMRPALEQLQADWVDYDPSLTEELTRCAQPPRNNGLPHTKGQDRSGPENKGPTR